MTENKDNKENIDCSLCKWVRFKHLDENKTFSVKQSLGDACYIVGIHYYSWAARVVLVIVKYTNSLSEPEIKFHQVFDGVRHIHFEPVNYKAPRGLRRLSVKERRAS